jgi:paraquat-inducible protein A
MTLIERAPEEPAPQDRGARERPLEDGAHEIVACPDCGLWQRLQRVPRGFRAECRRCRRALARPQSRTLDTSLALVTAALLVWLPTCIAPFMIVTADGAVRTSALASGVQGLWAAGFLFLAVLVAMFSIIVPWMYLALVACVLAGIRLKPGQPAGSDSPSPLGTLYRWGLALRPWAMIEVFLLGACVAYSRMQSVAFVSIGTAGWCLIAVTVLLLLLDACLDDRAVWRALPVGRMPQAAVPPTPGTALPACRVCDLPAPQARAGDRCPRCHARLVTRKPLSIRRTWSLVLCGFLLFIPANLMPVVSIEQFGRVAPNTILGGVLELLRSGLWPLAAIVFAASICIPLAKLCGLSWNLFLTQRGSARFLVGRTRLHRAIDLVGRWSNIDVFMVSITVALVQFGALTRVRVENGMIAFAAVVIVTMVAARSFDSRLMWDAAGEQA